MTNTSLVIALEVFELCITYLGNDGRDHFLSNLQFLKEKASQQLGWLFGPGYRHWSNGGALRRMLRYFIQKHTRHLVTSYWVTLELSGHVLHQWRTWAELTAAGVEECPPGPTEAPLFPCSCWQHQTAPRLQPSFLLLTSNSLIRLSAQVFVSVLWSQGTDSHFEPAPSRTLPLFLLPLCFILSTLPSPSWPISHQPHIPVTLPQPGPSPTSIWQWAPCSCPAIHPGLAP